MNLTRIQLPYMLTGVLAKPILKWAGGKSQLLEQIRKALPRELKMRQLTRYAEPFIGGGAVFFHIAQNFPVQQYYISDLNQELILLYKTIQRDVVALINQLGDIQERYYTLTSEQQEEFFYATRNTYNSKLHHVDFGNYSHDWIERSTQIIFLNRTCFNGLFRVNSKGEFNVPFGDYKNPRICDADNLRAVSAILQNTIIEFADFTVCDRFVDSQTFVYFDPPYRPISKTASFKAYSKHDFNDDEQRRLADFYRNLDARGAKLMLSNSDPQNENPDDKFFEEIYAGFNIRKVIAARNINSNGAKRGHIFELLITNY
jgi:DNA adenine methylase